MRTLNYLLVLLMGFALAFISCDQQPIVTPQLDDAITLRASSGEIFDMNDRFATETNGANGFGKVFVTQAAPTIEVKLIQVTGLIPNHDYELQVTVDFAAVYTTDCITSNPSGHWKITNFELPAAFAAGTFRLDLFLTHCHATVAGCDESCEGTGVFLTGLFDRDPLLACEPFVMVTVE